MPKDKKKEKKVMSTNADGFMGGGIAGAGAASAINSRFMDSANRKAKEYLKNPDTAMKVLGKAWDKAGNLKGEAKNLKGDLQVLSRMLRAVLRKEYTALPWSSLVKALGGIIYFLFIADLIPDFIPLLGLVDDAGIIAWVISSIRKDVTAFQDWEAHQSKSVRKHIDEPFQGSGLEMDDAIDLPSEKSNTGGRLSRR